MAIVWHDCASGQTARPYARRRRRRRRRYRRHRAATLTTKPVDP